MADLSGIAAALKASLSPDAAIREPAQAALQAGCATPGALMSLLNLCVVVGVEQDVAAMVPGRRPSKSVELDMLLPASFGKSFPVQT